MGSHFESSGIPRPGRCWRTGRAAFLIMTVALLAANWPQLSRSQTTSINIINA